jgi:hypothetical protein
MSSDIRGFDSLASHSLQASDRSSADSFWKSEESRSRNHHDVVQPPPSTTTTWITPITGKHFSRHRQLSTFESFRKFNRSTSDLFLLRHVHCRSAKSVADVANAHFVDDNN